MQVDTSLILKHGYWAQTSNLQDREVPSLVSNIMFIAVDIAVYPVNVLLLLANK